MSSDLSLLHHATYPNNWRSLPLSSVARVFAGSAAPQGEQFFHAGGPPFVRVSDLGQHGRTSNLTETRDHLSELALTTLPLVKARKGTVLFPKSGAAISTNTRAVLGIDAYIVSHLMAVEPGPETTSDWLFFWLSQLDMMQVADNSAYPSLKQSEVARLPVPLPPLPEQRRIAAKLQERLGAVNRALSAATFQRQAAARIPFALSREILTSTEAQKWPRRPFGELVDNYDGRRIPVKVEERRTMKGPYPYYGASGIIDHVNEFLFEGEYLLVAEDGANLLMRSTPVAFPASGQFWVNNHAHVVRPKPPLSIDYFLHFFSIFDLKPFVSGAAQPKLTQKDLNRIPVPVPPADQLKGVVEQLTSRSAAAKTLLCCIDRELESLRAFPAALLREAFSGRL